MDPRRSFIAETLSKSSAPAVDALAAAVQERHPGSAVLLYGSGASVLADADPSQVLYDFYVIAPSYATAFKSILLRAANLLLPPNVFYLEKETPQGRLRAKYAVLSIDHFERLVSKRTFHSYFWARFAQPCRIVSAPHGMRERIIDCVSAAIDTFVERSRPLADPGAGAAEIWLAGLMRSYRAELRAETLDRAAKLLAHYGAWPEQVTLRAAPTPGAGARVAWRMRAIQGGVLSVLRLLKGMATFDGGLDYIAWKISRHAGFALPVRAWERRFPLAGAPIVTLRYYRMRARNRRQTA